MLMKSCSFPSDPRLIEASRALLMVASGYEVVLWLGFLLLVGGWGPKMLSQFVSLSLDSLDAGSGCLEADEVRMLEDGKGDVVITKLIKWSLIKKKQDLILCLTVKLRSSLPCCVSDSTGSSRW